jgi:hypothetical protein
MKEYRSWSHYWRNLKSSVWESPIIRDSYFFLNLKEDDQNFYYDTIINKGVKPNKNGISIPLSTIFVRFSKKINRLELVFF